MNNNEAEIMPFNVNYYQVVLNLPRMLNLPISNEIESEEVAMQFLSAAQDRYPEAKLIRAGFLYYEEHEAGRSDSINMLKQKPKLYSRDADIEEHLAGIEVLNDE